MNHDQLSTNCRAADGNSVEEYSKEVCGIEILSIDETMQEALKKQNPTVCGQVGTATSYSPAGTEQE